MFRLQSLVSISFILHASGVPLDALRTLLVGVDDLLDMLVGQVVLPLAPLEMLGRVDEQDIIGLLALLQDEDKDRDAGRVEQVRRQADDGEEFMQQENWQF